nr:GMC oxidoreductase [Pseudomonas synxantha]
MEAGSSYTVSTLPPQIALARHVGGDASTTWVHTREVGSSTASGGLRAKILGGGSAINAAAFVRAPHSDFDRWADDGLQDWAYEQVLPYFKKSENADYGDDHLHGRQGPIPVHLRKKNDLSKTAQTFIDAALQAGFQAVDDINKPFPKGIGIYPQNVQDDPTNPAQDKNDRETRVNTAIAYLTKNVRQRKNLDIDKVLFNERCARGVRLANGREFAARQVVLSAGAIGMGAILLRSGIGPNKLLAAHCISLVADLPVDQGLMDQPNVYLQVVINGDGAILPTLGGKLWEQSSLAAPNELDIYLGFNHFANLAQSPTGKAFGIIACACWPRSRGKLELESVDPYALPRVSLNLLSVESDIKILIEAVAMMKRIAAQEPLKSQVVTIHFSDGSEVPTDPHSLREAIIKHVDSTLHVTSSAPMGPIGDSLAVLDEQGRVHGLSGLRVADASIFPGVPSVATNPTVIMAAEYIADRMKQAGPYEP